MVKRILTGVVGFALLVAPAAAEAKPADGRLFELRTYQAEPGKLDGLLAQFRNHTCKLFEKHGMTNVGYWVPVENPDRLLVYLLAYPDRAARDASWKGFMADEDWKKAAAASEVNGKLVARVEQRFLSTTDFSTPFSAASGGVDRLFEMRTYTTTPGNLPRLHKRFREHTTGLFAKHGMTNCPYFQLTAGQKGADDTLIYFLAHKDSTAAQESWAGFRADPVWVAAKKASEEAAGGSLTTPDGVKSLFLKAVDFSPVK